MTVEERMETNIRKGVLEYCVLALLRERDRYGLEIADELMARSLIASEGSLYPLLARMHAAGVVATRWENAESVRPRKYYAITSEGSTQLRTFTEVWARIHDSVDELMREKDS